jgi:hypothetical protein
MKMTTIGTKPLAALVTAGLLLTVAPPSALADSLNYNFWQLGYVAADIDGISPELDGWGIGGSYEVTDEIFISASYVDVGAKVAGLDVSEESLALSVGYAYPLAANTDLIGRVGYVRAEVDIEAVGDASDNGFSLGVGLRNRPLDPIELEASVVYVDLQDAGDSTSFGIGAFWYFTPQVALAVSGAFGDDVDSYTIGIRGTWGRSASRD